MTTVNEKYNGITTMGTEVITYVPQVHIMQDEEQCAKDKAGNNSEN